MTQRDPISKSQRFNIFARDGFTCQYCGRRPPEVVLELDHILAVSKGGTSDPINLITTCVDCNRGKAAKVLSEIKPRPDADLEFLRTQQELAEAKRYLDAKSDRDAVRAVVVDSLTDTWQQCLTPDEAPSDRQFLTWLNTFDAAEIESAIRKAVRKFNRKPYMQCWQLVKYVSGILYTVRRESEEE